LEYTPNHNEISQFLSSLYNSDSRMAQPSHRDLHHREVSGSSPTRRTTLWRRPCASDSATDCHSWRRTRGRRISTSFNITGSAAEPVAGENDLAQDPFNLAAERGLSAFDARNRFVGSYEWALPFWNHAQNWYESALGGWQLNGIATLMSGTPFTVFDSNDVAAQGSAPEITGFSAQRPNLVGNPNSGPRSVSSWLNTSAYQRLDPVANAGQFGTEGRNVNVGPAYADWDFAALKDIKVTESKQFQFRAELFNILNRANFHLPDSDISSPTFNHILEASAPRQVQFALKLMF
jgi:hypothetical protein